MPPGQIFTTGNIPLVSGGYPLTSLYVKEQSGTSGGGMPQLSAYTLRIYRVAGSSATNAEKVGADWLSCIDDLNVYGGRLAPA